MTLLELAKRCGKTIQAVAQAIEAEFKDSLSLSSNTHVPDKYVSSIIKKFHGSDLFLHTTNGESTRSPKRNSNGGSVTTPASNSKKSKEKKSEVDTKSSNNARRGDRKSNTSTEPQLTGKSLLKYLRGAVNKAILSGRVINYDGSRDAYFVEVLGFKSLLYSNEVASQKSLKAGETIDVVPLKVDGRNTVEYMTVSMRRVNEIIKNSRLKHPNKRQLEIEFDELEVGSQITGSVFKVEDNYIIVEYNGLRGIVYAKDLFWSRVSRIDFYWQVNAPITVKVIDKEIVDGKQKIRFSHKDCIPNIWESIDFEITENGFNENEEASVVEVNDNGIIISLAYDLEGFMPLSELSYEEFLFFQNDYSGEDMVAVYIKDFDAKRKKLILTRQPYYDEVWQGAESRYIPGKPYLAQIIGVSEDKIWVKFEEDVEACIGRTEFAWPNTGRNVHSFNVGESINVLIKEVDENLHRITASIRELTPDPWSMVDENLKGHDVEVKVVGLKEGKYLLIETLDNLRLRGKIMLSEISWQFSSIELPISMIPDNGDIISARIIVLSKDLRRLNLSIRQQHPDPWSELELGVVVRGKLGKMTNSGKIEVTLENGLTATTIENDLISMENEYIDFKVTECSRQTKNIEVSHSQLLYDRMNEVVIREFFGVKKV